MQESRLFTLGGSQINLEEGVGLVSCLLHGLEECKVEPSVPLDVVSDMWQEHKGQESLSHASIQIADKKPSGLVDSMRVPVLRLCQS